MGNLRTKDLGAFCNCFDDQAIFLSEGEIFI